MYVDGFLLAVPKRNMDAYRRLSRAAGKVWREFGALEYRECVGDDLGKMAKPFARGVRLKRGETIVFSWIVYRTRASRDRVNAKVMQDPRMTRMMERVKAMPFDSKRMGWGGFKVLVDM